MSAQLSFDMTGERLRDHGCARVIANSKEFFKMMEIQAKLVLREKGEVSSDDLRTFCAEANIQPHSPNVWGAVTLALKKGRRVIDRRPSTLSSNHGRYISVLAERD